MGVSLTGYSLAVGPLTRNILIFLMLFTMLQITGSTMSATCDPDMDSTQCCIRGMNLCSALFESAREQLGEIDYLNPRDHTPTPEKRNIICMAWRTLQRCWRELQTCKGDINYHATLKMAETRMNEYSCSPTGPVHSLPPVGQPEIPPCSFTGSNSHKYCGLFGDPHLRTFNNDFQTCSVKGAWPLINNDYLTVQVTNEDVGMRNGHATAISKVTVMIKRHHECGSDNFVTYQAQSDYFPAVFEDGRHHFGVQRSVQIREVQPNREVEIYLRYINTTLVVRRIGVYFSLAIKMPAEIANSSSVDGDAGLQLCVSGCPLSERIDHQRYLTQQHDVITSQTKRSRLKNQPLVAGVPPIVMSQESALVKCQSANLVDFYLDSCVFDLMTTGDGNFTQAAQGALQDLLKLLPAAQLKNRTDLLRPSKGTTERARSSARTCNLHYIHRTTYVLLTLCIALFLSHSPTFIL